MPKWDDWDYFYHRYDYPKFDYPKYSYSYKDWRAINKSLKDCSTEELKAELKKREEREALLKEMTWKNVMNVRGMNYNGRSITFNQIATIAHGLGYKFFVVQGYADIYQVLDSHMFIEGKLQYHCKALPIQTTEIK